MKTIHHYQTKTTHTMQPSRPGLTHRLPVVVLLLWSTFLVLTGCHPLSHSITRDPYLQIEPAIQRDPTNQTPIVVPPYGLTVESSEATFEQFFTEHGATAIWDRLLYYYKYPHIFKDIIDEANVCNEAKMNNLLLKHLPEEQAELKAAIIAYIQRKNQDTALRDLLHTQGLDTVWHRLNQAKAKDSLDLTGMLQTCHPTLQQHILEHVVHFIRRHIPNLVTLDLSHNGLTHLPASFGKLTQLRTLILFQNNLTQLETSLQDLINLTELYLEKNQLTDSARFLKDHPNLAIVTPMCNGPLNYSNKELAFWQILNQHGLHEISARLLDAKTTQQPMLNLSRQLQNCPPSLQTEILVQLVQFIVNNCPNLVVLDLSHNGLTQLPDTFGKLSQLSQLHLDDNKLETFPNSFVNLTNLVIFTAFNNPLSCPSLEIAFEYFLRNNGLQAILNTLQYVQNNRTNHLNLRGMLQTCTPEVQNYVLRMIVHYITDHCPHVVSLDLSDNGLTDLPDTFGQLMNLRALSLSGNNLTTLPLSFGNLINLQQLYLSNNPFTYIPPTFANLITLKELHLKNDQVINFYAYLLQFNNLQLIQENDDREQIAFFDLLNSYGLHEICKKVQRAQQDYSHLRLAGMLRVCHSDMRSHVIQQLGQYILAYLPHLEGLDLSDNGLTELPEAFGYIRGLVELNLSDNNLSELPASISYLCNLKMLDLHSNQLTALPDNFGNLTQLYTLDLHNNQLTALPKSFGKLNQLYTLLLHFNRLTALPDNFGNLTELHTVTLHYGNQVTVLPGSIQKLTKLQDFALDGNPLLELSRHIDQIGEELTMSNVNRLFFPSLTERAALIARRQRSYNHTTGRPNLPQDCINAIEDPNTYPVILFVNQVGREEFDQAVPLYLNLTCQEIVDHVCENHRVIVTKEGIAKRANRQ